ncbi:MAG: hypothetical protein K9G46_08620 [Flavobacteriales bacterium]|nr:hypothetical protein [Flavobacteriales bacterium]
MKNLLVFLLLAVLIAGCKKNDSDYIPNGLVTIKGSTSENKKSINSLSEATKVLVLKIHIGSITPSFVDIIDGAFSYTTESGVVTALVFLDVNNQYLGTLSPQGLNLLPLLNLADGDNAIIDLETLTLDGNSILPSHDPLGNDIIISNEEVNSLKELDGFFESLAKNIDADNDSILDLINHKQLYITNRFTMGLGGKYGLNNTAPIMNEIGINNIGYSLEVRGDLGFGVPNSLVFSGPNDNPYQNITTQFINPNGNGGFYSVVYRQENGTRLPFTTGTYTLLIDNNPYSLAYSTINPTNSLIVVVPTLITNSEGKLTAISLEYKLPDGSSIDPTSILSDVMVQFNDASANQFYDTPRLVNTEIENCDCVVGLYSYTLDTPVDISALESVYVGYNDFLGNSYAISWYE